MNKGYSVAILILVAALLVVINMGARISHLNDELFSSEMHYKKVATGFRDHLADEYIKNVCNVTLSGPRATDKTDKDEACIAGVTEKARKEVEAIR
jgi:hypothetical protein